MIFLYNITQAVSFFLCFPMCTPFSLVLLTRVSLPCRFSPPKTALLIVFRCYLLVRIHFYHTPKFCLPNKLRAYWHYIHSAPYTHSDFCNLRCAFTAFFGGEIAWGHLDAAFERAPEGRWKALRWRQAAARVDIRKRLHLLKRVWRRHQVRCKNRITSWDSRKKHPYHGTTGQNPKDQGDWIIPYFWENDVCKVCLAESITKIFICSLNSDRDRAA